MDGCREVGVEHHSTKITEPDADDDEDRDPDWSDRRTQRVIAAGDWWRRFTLANRSRPRRPRPGDMGRSAEEAALHVVKPPPADTTD